MTSGIVLVCIVLMIGVWHVSTVSAAFSISSSVVGIGEVQTDAASVTVSAEDKFGIQGKASAAVLSTTAERMTVEASDSAASDDSTDSSSTGSSSGSSSTSDSSSNTSAATSVTSSVAWKTATVSWYGPGLYGSSTASGKTLAEDSMFVANRTLPFGTRVEFSYNGKTVIATVEDRGPYIDSREFDLGPGVATALGFDGVGTVKYRVLG